MLRSVEIPPYGGDTCLGQLRAGLADAQPGDAGDAAPAESADVSAANNIYTQKLADGKELSFANEAERSAAIEGRAHPLVRTHPVTANSRSMSTRSMPRGSTA